MLGLGLTKLLPALIYWAAIIAIFLSVLGKPKIGLFFVILFIPFENVSVRLHEYFPQGENIKDYLYLAVLIGCFVQAKSKNTEALIGGALSKYVVSMIAFTIISLVVGSVFFNLGNPFDLSNQRFLDWKNYMMLPILFFMVRKLVKTEKEIKLLIILMMIALFFADIHYYQNIKDKTLSSFMWTLKVSGIFVYLGGNELAAFFAHFIFLPIGLVLYEKNKISKLLLVGLICITFYPIFFLFSRGAYIGVFCGLLYVGLKRSKILIVALCLLVIFWMTVLPKAVVERIQMTKSEETGEVDMPTIRRIELWSYCLNAFTKSPIIGLGIGTFEYFGPGKATSDPHNWYLETLSEQGIIGLWIFLAILYLTFKNGNTLIKIANTSFLKGFGLTVSAAVVACGMTNFFGDRWSYLPLGAFFWVLMALADRGVMICKNKKALENKTLEGDFAFNT